LNKRLKELVPTFYIGVVVSIALRIYDPSTPIVVSVLTPLMSCVIVDVVFTLRRMRERRQQILESSVATDDLASLKAELAKNPEAFEQKIIATRIDQSLAMEAPDANLPTVSELIEAGRDPEEVGEMLASGKARNG
jgi:hypothetical protein